MRGSCKARATLPSVARSRELRATSRANALDTLRRSARRDCAQGAVRCANLLGRAAFGASVAYAMLRQNDLAAERLDEAVAFRKRCMAHQCHLRNHARMAKTVEESCAIRKHAISIQAQWSKGGQAGRRLRLT
eukprot:6174031-Pleurochrysis_carterae.AAC.2